MFGSASWDSILHVWNQQFQQIAGVRQTSRCYGPSRDGAFFTQQQNMVPASLSRKWLGLLHMLGGVLADTMLASDVDCPARMLASEAITV